MQLKPMTDENRIWYLKAELAYKETALKNLSICLSVKLSSTEYKRAYITLKTALIALRQRGHIPASMFDHVITIARRDQAEGRTI